MFTGIVQTRGYVAALDRNAFGVRLAIDPRGWKPRGAELLKGDSVCVSGVCLTLVEFSPRGLEFDVIAETLAKTTLGGLAVGSEVNLEPSLTANTPMGGHFLQGHVDGVGTIINVLATPAQYRITVAPPAEMMDYIIPKGSVSIDGVSLTLASVGKNDFDVALIPTTLEMTTLGDAKAGDRVNLEADILAKTIVHYLRRQAAK
jgi:riboflavin synthase